MQGANNYWVHDPIALELSEPVVVASTNDSSVRVTVGDDEPVAIEVSPASDS